MKYKSSVSFIVFSSLLSASLSSYAEQSIEFKPKQTGAPSNRIGAGTRHTTDETDRSFKAAPLRKPSVPMTEPLPAPAVPSQPVTPIITTPPNSKDKETVPPKSTLPQSTTETKPKTHKNKTLSFSDD